MNTTAHNRTARRFRFAFREARGTPQRNRLRAQIAELITGWMAARIVGEKRCKGESMVIFELYREVPVKVAEAFARQLPNYVPDSFSPADCKTDCILNRR